MYPQDDKCKRENKAREYNIRSVAIFYNQRTNLIDLE